jgi:hypothetical protein
MRVASRSGIPIDFDSLPTRYPYTLMVSQAVTERVLLQRLRELTEYIRYRARGPGPWLARIQFKVVTTLTGADAFFLRHASRDLKAAPTAYASAES